MAVSEEDKAKATALKNQGNDAFKKHDWPTAIDFYTQAIGIDDTEPTFYANRAQVRIPYSGSTRSRLAPFVARVTNIVYPNDRPTSRPRHMAMQFRMRPRRSS